MKQLTISSVVDAFADEPISIGDRLEILGVPKSEQAKKFSASLLKTQVYASSFVKFLADNSSLIDDKIPAKELPADYKNPFDSSGQTVRDRLDALGISAGDYQEMFDNNTLDLSLTGVEFQDFILNNQDRFLGKLEKLANLGG